MSTFSFGYIVRVMQTFRFADISLGYKALNVSVCVNVLNILMDSHVCLLVCAFHNVCAFSIVYSCRNTHVNSLDFHWVTSEEMNWSLNYATI